MSASQSEPPKLNHVAPAWFKDRWEEMRGWLRANRIVEGDNIRVTDADGGGKKVDAILDSSSIATNIHHPFKVYTRKTPEAETTDRLVEYRSSLLTNLTPVASQSITGLGTVDEPEEEDDGWALLIANDLIWLEVNFDAEGVAIGASIKSYGAGDEWEAFEGGQSLVEWSGTGTTISPFVQTKARAVIARAPADAEGKPRIVQALHSDLLLALRVIGGKILYVPEPIAGALV